MYEICKFSNVTKRYKDHIIFNNLNLTINKGEMVAIVGKSGSGKTTILNLMGLLDKQDSGTISLFGENTTNYKVSKKTKMLRNKISYLFQNFALIDHYSVGTNLEIPLTYIERSKKKRNQLMIEALQKVGLSIPVSQKVYKLSGGEQQRLSIARLLLKPSELILADEPTGSLDAENRDEIIELLRGLNKEGKTLVIVTHDPEVANKCHRIIQL
ncbi:ABC transporter ATP-binding protein [Sporosarcina sp. Te-1]|uniref:ABC transporter ATP-binding protein n=1 Tax=Sporosarcina sp. Te-1 TaxID=2818390 RepID=UPI001A9CE279|nr:ABC transporter ATP-binding protein [Sporosarcina sp. Te-1]QTD42767.1 ABC transporter ATP-binding protein [Sporosarcina sp. Te-1]